MAPVSKVAVGSVLGAGALATAFVAPGSRPVELEPRVASASQKILSSASSSSSPSAGLSSALAVGGLSVAAAAARRKAVQPRASRSVVACRGFLES